MQAANSARAEPGVAFWLTEDSDTSKSFSRCVRAGARGRRTVDTGRPRRFTVLTSGTGIGTAEL